METEEFVKEGCPFNPEVQSRVLKASDGRGNGEG